MRRPALIWLVFFLFLALGLGAMGWMTRTVLRLERAQVRATAAAQLEENVRLALWRMDGALGPILGPEIARPYFEYSPVFPAERAYTRMYTELKSGDVLVPSPLLKPATPYVLLHFQVEPDGKVTSPQAPAGDVRRIAEARYTTAANIAEAERRLAEVEKLVRAPSALATLPPPRDAENWSNNKIRVATNGTLSNTTLNFNRENTAANPQYAGGGGNRANQSNYNGLANGPAQQQQELQSPLQQQLNVEQQAAVQQRRGQQEFGARQQALVDNNDLLAGNNAGNFVGPGVSFGVMTPLWVGGDTLILARQVSVNGRAYVQGCLLDWPAIRKSLLESAADLLPESDLVPVRAAADDAQQPRRLASIPVRLVIAGGEAGAAGGTLAGPTFWAAVTHPSPTGLTLMMAWLGVLLASAAVAVLLRGVIALSQRRAGFVSAVTHELRTPLTTLRMYTEMLADGMVADPAKQAAYHKTLRAEANRLGHLVDNVLLYSRLERSNRDTRVEPAPLAGLLERLTPRLADRAAQAGMTLNVGVSEAARGAEIRANLLSVEQILFNLVDNACKYAGGAAERGIDVTVDREGDRIEVRVSDHGPGLDALARARLFEPFSKSVHEAANSAPGLGLGLALSRRLARNMGADLRLDGVAKGGATFVLSLVVG